MRASARWAAIPVTVTAGDVSSAVEAVYEAAEYAGREASIDSLEERFARARAVWFGTEKRTERRAREVCKILFGVQKGRRPANKKWLRYAWSDLTTCEIRRPTQDASVGHDWQRKTWGDVNVAPPAGAGRDDQIIQSLQQLPYLKRRPYAVRVIQVLFNLPQVAQCLQALRRAGIEGLPSGKTVERVLKSK